MRAKKNNNKKWIIIGASALFIIVAVVVAIIIFNGGDNKISSEVANATAHYEFETDAKGRNVKKTAYDPDNQVNAYEKYEYDENGNRVKTVITDKNGVVTQEESVEYYNNDPDKMLKRTVVDGKGNLISVQERKYKDGKVIEESSAQYKNGVINSKTVTTYDDKMEVVDQKTTKYDEKGNPRK